MQITTWKIHTIGKRSGAPRWRKGKRSGDLTVTGSGGSFALLSSQFQSDTVSFQLHLDLLCSEGHTKLCPNYNLEADCK